MRVTDSNFEISRRDIDVVAFDWDGTVVDSVPYKLKQNQAIAAEFGNELTADQVRTTWNRAGGFQDLMKQLTGSDDMAAIMYVVERDYNNPAYAKHEFGYAKATLRTVRKLGLPRGSTNQCIQGSASARSTTC